MTPLEHVVVVGASLAGLAAARALRAEGFTGRLTIVGEEVHRPYDRPPLSKSYLGPSDTHPDLGSHDVADVDWVLGSAAVGLELASRQVRLADGSTVDFDGLIIATGTTPRSLPDYDKRGVVSLRTLDDAVALRDALGTRPSRVVLVGGGFISAEVASTCVSQGIPVTLVEREDQPFSRSLGAAVGAELTRFYVRHGVDVRRGTTVRRVLGGATVTGVELDDGSTVEAGLLLLSIGVLPATGWLEGSGLPLDDGVVCDETLQVVPGVVAAGDVARWPNRRLGEFRRIEHWEHAITSGEHAARTLLGRAEPYELVPWVWSDQFGVKLQFVGSSLDHDEVLVDSSLDTDGRFLALYRKGDRLWGACGIRRNKLVLGLRDSVGRPGSWAAAVERALIRSAA